MSLWGTLLRRDGGASRKQSLLTLPTAAKIKSGKDTRMNHGLLARLLRNWTDHTSPGSAAAHFRHRRFSAFSSLVDRLPHPVRILDVGGDSRFWTTGAAAGMENIRVTVLNLQHQPGSTGSVPIIQADARQLPFSQNHTFDVVYSNSVIEHVGSFPDQQRMAAEIQRVAKSYFIQTPSRWFPLEPHFLFPFFQFLPFSWRVWIASHYRGGWYCHPGDPEAAKKEVASIRLLTRRDCHRLFPGAKIRTERLFGLTKSYVILGGWCPTGLP